MATAITFYHADNAELLSGYRGVTVHQHPGTQDEPRAKTELMSDVPLTDLDMLRAPPTPTQFCNLDWPVTFAMAAGDPDTVGESFGPNANTAQKAGTLTGTAKPITLTQESVPRKYDLSYICTA